MRSVLAKMEQSKWLVCSPGSGSQQQLDLVSFLLLLVGAREPECESTLQCLLSPRYVPGSRKESAPVSGGKGGRQEGVKAPCRGRCDKWQRPSFANAGDL